MTCFAMSMLFHNSQMSLVLISYPCFFLSTCLFWYWI